MSDTERQRWETIVERETLGDPIAAEDLAFRSEYEREHPECARETLAWNEMLGALAEEATSEGREHIESLASRVLVQRDVERDVLRPLAPRVGKRTALRAAMLTTAAAAAVAVIVSTQTGDDPAAASAQRARSTPEASPDAAEPVPAPSPVRPGPRADDENAQLGRLALAGPGIRVDGGPVTAGAAVHAGQRIDFDPAPGPEGTSGCVVQHEPWITTCFSRGSALVFTQTEDGTAVALERGRVLATLDPLPGGRRFSVVTSKGTVSAVGTSFEVWIDAQGSVYASVLDGRVEVRDPKGARTLEAGDTLELGAEASARLGADALAWSRAHVDVAQLWRTAGLGVLRLVPPGGASASFSIDALAVGPAPLSLLLAPGEHLVATAGSARGVWVDIEEGATRELSPGSVDAAERPAPARPRLTAQDLVRRANEARSAHRYGDAARHLERVLRDHPDSPDAQNARVELGDLMLDKLGKPAKALALYDAYLARGGSLTLEAHYGRARALERLGRTRDERAAIDEFLSKHPGDWRTKQLRERQALLGEP